jgi:hypothetical protein
MTWMKLAKTLALNPTTILEQVALLFAGNKIKRTMDAHEFIDYELEFDLNNPYILIEEEIIGMLDEGGDVVDKEPIEVLTMCKLVIRW